MRSTAPESRRGVGGAAFTLVEVLLVLALMALVGTLLLPTASGLFTRPDGGSPEDVLAETFQKVRRDAVLSGREIPLRFDERSRLLAWPGGTSDAFAPEGHKAKVEFLRARGTSSVLIGGQLVETDPVPVLTFYPDGTCDPVRVQLRLGNTSRIVAIDPWTCATGLEVRR